MNLCHIFTAYCCRTDFNCKFSSAISCKCMGNYCIFWPIAHVLSIQKRSEIVKNEHARYTLERFLTDNVRLICTKKGIGKYSIMY
jgi:hypothetical protein